MRDYVLSAPSREALTSAVEVLASSGQRMDVAQPRATAEEIAPDEFGPITWTLDVALADGVALPDLPEGVVATEGPNGFTAARAAAPAPASDGSARPPWYDVKAVQAYAACDLFGLTPKIEAILAQLPDGPQKIIATRAWQKSTQFSFDDQTLSGLWPLLGMKDEDKEALFRAAYEIKT